MGGCIPDKCYKIVVAGATGNETPDNIIRDDNGINISNKNPLYCEMTVLFFIWKNVRSDVKGLCHYRRFLAHSQYGNRTDILSDEDIEHYMREYNLLLPKPLYKTHNNNHAHWYKTERELNNDVIYCILRKSVMTSCPDYTEDLRDVFLDDYMVYSNIIVAKDDVFDLYCRWAFDLLEEVEENYRLIMGDIPNREIGYISEYLINVWIRHNLSMLKIKFFPVMRTDNRKDMKHTVLMMTEKCGLMGVVQRVMSRWG